MGCWQKSFHKSQLHTFFFCFQFLEYYHNYLINQHSRLFTAKKDPPQYVSFFTKIFHLDFLLFCIFYWFDFFHTLKGQPALPPPNSMGPGFPPPCVSLQPYKNIQKKSENIIWIRLKYQLISLIPSLCLSL